MKVLIAGASGSIGTKVIAGLTDSAKSPVQTDYLIK